MGYAFQKELLMWLLLHSLVYDFILPFLVFLLQCWAFVFSLHFLFLFFLLEHLWDRFLEVGLLSHKVLLLDRVRSHPGECVFPSDMWQCLRLLTGSSLNCWVKEVFFFSPIWKVGNDIVLIWISYYVGRWAPFHVMKWHLHFCFLSFL